MFKQKENRRKKLAKNKRDKKCIKKGNTQREVHVKADYPHFRYYKKSGHPALIIGEQDKEEYLYRKVMHGAKDGKRTNEKVEPNPKWGDCGPMYIGKRVRHDTIYNFENRPLPWKYPKK